MVKGTEYLQIRFYDTTGRQHQRQSVCFMTKKEIEKILVLKG